ncbi:MAG TPA: bifunctional diaminohydroxyphosphoribosylaminopyrimidine deaminase/5-amino-6-(5-phosphoribosylamino)uracil reductase RibD [Gemmatimonadales bacterium]
MTEAEAMRRALELAWRGWGRVHPNPMVGAVVLREGQIIGEGWHAEFGGAHAEVEALANVSAAAAEGATLVVTLEPCRHHGKTPSCTEAIFDAGIARVVFGADDPSPEARGGAAQLADVGIQVDRVPVENQVRRQNAAFFHELRHPTRPFVALKLATSIDARLADYTGRSHWLSAKKARDWVHWLRAGFDAIAVGGRTARVDNPSLTVRGPVSPRVPPRRVVFDRHAHLAGATTLLGSAREIPVLLVCEGTPVPDQAAEYAQAGVDILEAGNLTLALQGLYARGVKSLLVEGGGRLAGRLLGAGLIDRFYWLQTPLWLGEGGVPAFAGLHGELLEQVYRWTPVERRSLGPDTLLVLDRQHSGQ